MSTIAIEQKRFADISASLAHYTDGVTSNRAPMLASIILNALKIPLFGSEAVSHRQSVDAIIFDWARLNGAAWASRYCTPGRPQISPDFNEGKPLSLLALLKALDCLHYNCDGGSDHSNSLALLKSLKSAICSQIVRGSKTYDSCGWDESSRCDYLPPFASLTPNI